MQNLKDTKQSGVEFAGHRLPEWTVEEMRVLLVLDALRLRALVELLESKGVFTRQDFLDSISNQVQHIDKVLESLTFVSEERMEQIRAQVAPSLASFASATSWLIPPTGDTFTVSEKGTVEKKAVKG